MIRIKWSFGFAFSLLFATAALAEQLDTAPFPLSPKDIYAAIDLHNRVRCQVAIPAASMPTMSWDDKLYTVAQNYANKCVFAHNANRTNDYAALGGSGYVGENIFASFGSPGINLVPQAILAFAGEKTYYTYPTTCVTGKVCGHYTQQVWANSLRVACAQTNCTGDVGTIKGQFVVCNYSPGGNYAGAAPYVAAPMGTPSGPRSQTDACIAASRLPINYIATVTSSSNKAKLPNLFDQNDATFWSPNLNDPDPLLSFVFQQKINIDTLNIKWAGAGVEAFSFFIEYSPNANGSGLVTLPVAPLPRESVAILPLKLSAIQYLKIHFIRRGTGIPIRIVTLDLMDPSFSVQWS